MDIGTKVAIVVSIAPKIPCTVKGYIIVRSCGVEDYSQWSSIVTYPLTTNLTLQPVLCSETIRRTELLRGVWRYADAGILDMVAVINDFRRGKVQVDGVD